jgi:hypothetical protein
VETENLEIINTNCLLEKVKLRQYICQIPLKKRERRVQGFGGETGGKETTGETQA